MDADTQNNTQAPHTTNQSEIRKLLIHGDFRSPAAPANLTDRQNTITNREKTENFTAAPSNVDRPSPVKFIRRRKGMSLARVKPEALQVNEKVQSWQQTPSDDFDLAFLKLVESIASDQLVADLNQDR